MVFDLSYSKQTIFFLFLSCGFSRGHLEAITTNVPQQFDYIHAWIKCTKGDFEIGSSATAFTIEPTFGDTVQILSDPVDFVTARVEETAIGGMEEYRGSTLLFEYNDEVALSESTQLSGVKVLVPYRQLKGFEISRGHTGQITNGEQDSELYFTDVDVLVVRAQSKLDGVMPSIESPMLKVAVWEESEATIVASTDTPISVSVSESSALSIRGSIHPAITSYVQKNSGVTVDGNILEELPTESFSETSERNTRVVIVEENSTFRSEDPNGCDRVAVDDSSKCFSVGGLFVVSSQPLSEISFPYTPPQCTDTSSGPVQLLFTWLLGCIATAVAVCI